MHFNLENMDVKRIYSYYEGGRTVTSTITTRKNGQVK